MLHVWSLTLCCLTLLGLTVICSQNLKEILPSGFPATEKGLSDWSWAAFSSPIILAQTLDRKQRRSYFQAAIGTMRSVTSGQVITNIFAHYLEMSLTYASLAQMISDAEIRSNPRCSKCRISCPLLDGIGLVINENFDKQISDASVICFL